MTSAFDPYYVWLGIPPHEQPPNHYRLLGIACFEDDPEVIEQAAERQLAFLRQQRTTPYRDLAERLEKEVQAARRVLLDPNKKAAYDQSLRGPSPFHTAATDEGQDNVSSPGTLSVPKLVHLLRALVAPVLFLWNHPTLTSLLAACIVLSAAGVVAFTSLSERGPSESDQIAGMVGEPPQATPAPSPPGTAAVDSHGTAQTQVGERQTPVQGPQAIPQVPAVPQRPTVAPGQIPDKSPPQMEPLAPGLIGRLAVNGEDVGAILRYTPGESVSQAALNQLIAQYGLTPGEQRLVLSGVIRVQPPQGQPTLPIRMTLTADPNALSSISVQIDGRPMPFPTTSQDGVAHVGSVLARGDHPIVCQFQGKDLGQVFRLDIVALPTLQTPQADTVAFGKNEPLVVGYTAEDLAKVTELPTLGRHILNDELTTLAASDLIPGQAAESPPPPAETPPPPTTVAQQGRQPVPLQTELLRAREEIRAKYRKDLQEATAPEARALLARTMLKEGNAERDPARQYMLYEEARELAIAAGDPDVAIQAGEAMALAFEVDPWPMHMTAVNQLSKTARTPQTRENVLGILQPLCDSAIAEDRYDVADSLLDLAINLAGQLRDAVRREQFSRQRDDVKKMATAFEAIQRPLEVLKESPDDPQANEAVGRFYCFVKHDWKKGLPYLAKAETVLLQTVAQSELNRQVGTAARLQLADDWWAIGETLSDAEKAAVRRHAGYYYLQCVGFVSGEAAQRVNTRLAESGRVTDLLSLAAARRATVVGNWQIGPKSLVSAPEPMTQIAFPVVPPTEYDLVVEIQSVPLPTPRGQGGSPRPDPNLDLGRGAFAVGLIQQRRQFLAVTDFQVPNQGLFSFLADYDKRGPDPANPTFRPMSVIRSQRPTLIVYSVKKTGLTVTANGTPIIQYNGDYSQLSMPQGWNPSNQPRIFFATRLAVYRITRAELRDVTE